MTRWVYEVYDGTVNYGLIAVEAPTLGDAFRAAHAELRAWEVNPDPKSTFSKFDIRRVKAKKPDPMTVECPTCGKPAGEPCRTMIPIRNRRSHQSFEWGPATKNPHPARTAAAKGACK
jgi:hypothetical protein